MKLSTTRLVAIFGLFLFGGFFWLRFWMNLSFCMSLSECQAVWKCQFEIFKRSSTPPKNVVTGNVAVIIDNRKTSAIIDAMKNVLEVLDKTTTSAKYQIGDLWNVQAFVTEENKNYFCEFHETRAWLETGRLTLTDLETTRHSLEHDSTAFNAAQNQYNTLLASKSFWESVQGERVLIFQADAVLCSLSPFRIDAFYGYDYVGSKWLPHTGQLRSFWQHPSRLGHTCRIDEEVCGGNGGLSLRKKTAMLEVVSNASFHHLFNEGEDAATVYAMIKLGKKVATSRVSAQFSSQYLIESRSFAAHKILSLGFHGNQTMSLADRIDQIQKLSIFCPEVRRLAWPTI